MSPKRVEENTKFRAPAVRSPLPVNPNGDQSTSSKKNRLNAAKFSFNQDFKEVLLRMPEKQQASHTKNDTEIRLTSPKPTACNKKKSSLTSLNSLIKDRNDFYDL